MACVNWIRSSTTAILHLFSQGKDLLTKVILKCVNIKLWDILGCFHYILNAPRNVKKLELFTKFDFSADKTNELQRIDTELHRLIIYLDSKFCAEARNKLGAFY